MLVLCATVVRLALLVAPASVQLQHQLQRRPHRCGLPVCDAAVSIEEYEEVEEDAQAAAFFADFHPVVKPAQLSVGVSRGERKSGSLTDATLQQAGAVLRKYGVVRLRGVWDAKPRLVQEAAGALHENYEACVERISARTGLTEADSFAYCQIVHRSAGRYDMLLGDGVAMKPLPSTVSDAVLGCDATEGHWRHQLLSSFLGEDYNVEFTAGLLARTGCATQEPHADGMHPHDNREASDVADTLPLHALQLFLPLCKVTTRRGPTEFWTSSHHAAYAPYASFLPSIALEADAGDAIIFDFRVVHRGMANTSGRWRPILYQTCTAAWFTDDFNFPAQSLLHDEQQEGVTDTAGEAPASEQAGAGERNRFTDGFTDGASRERT